MDADPSRVTDAQGPDAAVGLAGGPREQPRRLWLQPLLRPLPAVVKEARHGAAPGASRRREAVRGITLGPVLIPVHNPESGDVHPAAVFVAVLGASSYTFAEATTGQDLRNWIGSHIRAWEFYGGVAEVVVPDNLKRLPSHIQAITNRDPEPLPRTAIWASTTAWRSFRRGRIGPGTKLTFHTAPHPACAKVKVGCLARRPPWPFRIAPCSSGSYRQRRIHLVP